MKLETLICKYRIVILAFFWLGGFYLGTHFVRATGESVLPLLQSSAFRPVSVPRVVSSVFMPFLISSLVVLYFPPLLVLICFFKAFSSGFLFRALVVMYGGSYWIVSFFILFCDLFTCPLLFFYESSLLYGYRSSKLHFVVYLLVSCIIIIFLLVVSPFWQHLIT
jgi:hypothetical protein